MGFSPWDMLYAGFSPAWSRRPDARRPVRAQMKGADIHTVALILGHKDLRMAARYRHLSPAFLSDAVKLLDGAYAEKPKNAEAETPKEPEMRLIPVLSLL